MIYRWQKAWPERWGTLLRGHATDQIGPVLGSDFVASFDHLAGTRVRTRMFESAKEAAPASSFWEKHIRTGVPDKSQKKVSPKSRTKSRATGATPSQTIPSQGIPKDWTLKFSRGLGDKGACHVRIHFTVAGHVPRPQGRGRYRSVGNWRTGYSSGRSTQHRQHHQLRFEFSSKL